MKKVDLQEVDSNAASEQPAATDLSHVFETVEVALDIRVGTLTVSLGELKSLTSGQVLTLQQKINEPVELMLNGQTVAHGKLTVVEEHFAVEITEVPH